MGYYRENKTIYFNLCRYIFEELKTVFRCGDSSLLLESVDYFLALFPVFTLSTSFPIIGITLRNNLESILAPHSTLLADQKYRRIIFPLLGNGNMKIQLIVLFTLFLFKLVYLFKLVSPYFRNIMC